MLVIVGGYTIFSKNAEEIVVVTDCNDIVDVVIEAFLEEVVTATFEIELDVDNIFGTDIMDVVREGICTVDTTASLVLSMVERPDVSPIAVVS